MSRFFLRAGFALLAALLVYMASPNSLAYGASIGAQHWVGSWAVAPMADAAPFKTPNFASMTLRQIVRPSIAGEALRIRFTNEFGTQPLKIEAAHVALSAGGNAIQSGSDHSVTFDGQSSVSIPPGVYVLSDPVAMATKPFAELAVSMYLPAQQISNPTDHPTSSQTSYIADGNVVSAATLETPATVDSWYFLKGVDVETKADDTAAAVTFGDSITDGFGSTLNENHRWPDYLAEQLQAVASTKRLSVLNEGISGNRVLRDGAGPSALARFDRDVLAQAGVKYLIVLESINDIGQLARPNNPEGHVTAQDLELGLDQLVERAHEHGIKVFGATLTPYKGTFYYSQEGEQVREAVNRWIRSSRVFDGLIDFEKAVEDPADPLSMLPAYNHGDHIHPNDAGYRAMANVIHLELFDVKSAH